MLYVGLDLHKSHITGCVLDSDGKVFQRWQVKDETELTARLIELPPFEVCFEASTGYGRFYELLGKVAARVAVAHPGLLRLIYQSKGLWTKKGAAWLTSLEFDHSLHAVKRTMLVEELETHSKHIRLVEKELGHFSLDNPAVQLLMTIPGVGLRTAEAVVAFIDDPHRFANSKRLGSYFGLVPSQDQSGRTNRLGHITKEGAAVVRAMLTEAVWQAVRRSPTVKAFQQRIQRGDPDRRKISVIATAHYLVRVMWSMLKNGSLWKEQVPLTTAA